MKFCYAHRRYVLYPEVLARDNVDHLRPDQYSDDFIRSVVETGFEAIEMPQTTLAHFRDDESSTREFSRRFKDAGIPIVALRVAGSFINPKYAENTRIRLASAVEFARVVGANIINVSLRSPTANRGKPGNPYPGEIGASFGWNRLEVSSRDASMTDFERSADELRAACDTAAEFGITLCAEVHPYTIVDNSWSALLVHRLVSRNNFGINPDTGNPYWSYAVPEESTEELMDAVAPVSVYWHAKSMMRIYHPENERAVFVRVPLPNGEIDYRYAMSAMISSGFDGYMALESLQTGDQWDKDRRSLDYVKSLAAEIEAEVHANR